MTKKRTIIIMLHIGFWLLTFLPYIDKSYVEFVGSDLKYLVMIEFYSLVFPFYINYFLFSKLIEKKKHLYYIFIIFGFTAFYVLFARFFEQYWILANENYNWQYIHIILGILLYILISTVFKSIFVWFKNKEIENDKIQAELNFLKIQINPHFLFNTLNNIYSLEYTNDKKTAPMIAGLSKILHYMLYDCKENTVLLDKEIEFLRNYIKLQQLRFEENKNIDLYTEGVNINHRIAPLILLTLLENSFKHGDINTNDKAWIHVECVVVDNILYFKISNSVSELGNIEQKNKGIGNLNVKNQLKIHYHKKHNLQIEKTETEYIIDLKIDLNL